MSQSGLPTIVTGMFLKNKVCQPHGEVKPNKNQLKYTPQNLSKSNMTMETQAFEDVLVYLSYEQKW